MRQVRPERVRALIYSRLDSAPESETHWSGWLRARRDRRTYRHWYMEITDGEKIIHRDDCQDLAKLHDEATELVASYRNLMRAGRTFKSWRELVDEAVI